MLRGSRSAFASLLASVVTSSFMHVMVEITLVTTFLDTEECKYNSKLYVISYKILSNEGAI